MTDRPAYGFDIDGVRYPLALEEAAAISDRLAHRHDGDMNHPAYAAQVMVDEMIDGRASDNEWHGREKDELFAAIQVWLDEDGTVGVPVPVQNIRYGVFGEREDRARTFPPGLYHVAIELGDADTDAVEHRETAPVPGEAITVGGRTVVVKTVTPTPGSEYVATIVAVHHPG